MVKFKTLCQVIPSMFESPPRLFFLMTVSWQNSMLPHSPNPYLSPQINPGFIDWTQDTIAYEVIVLTISPMSHHPNVCTFLVMSSVALSHCLWSFFIELSAIENIYYLMESFLLHGRAWPLLESNNGLKMNSSRFLAKTGYPILFVHWFCPPEQCFSVWFPRLATLTSPGNLLGMQIIRSHYRSTD